MLLKIKKDRKEKYSIQEYKKFTEEIRKNKRKRIKKIFITLLLGIFLMAGLKYLASFFKEQKERQFIENYKKASQFLDIKPSDIISFDSKDDSLYIKTKACTFSIGKEKESFVISSIKNLNECINFAKREFYFNRDITKEFSNIEDQDTVRKLFIEPVEKALDLKFSGFTGYEDENELFFKRDINIKNKSGIDLPPCWYPLEISYIIVSKKEVKEKIRMDKIYLNGAPRKLCTDILFKTHEKKFYGSDSIIVKKNL